MSMRRILQHQLDRSLLFDNSPAIYCLRMKILIRAVSLFLFSSILTGCSPYRTSEMLQRNYGQLSWHEFPSLGIRMQIPSSKTEIIKTENGNVCIRANQLPGEEPGLGHMFFIGMTKISNACMQTRWRKAASETNLYSKWLNERHDTCDLKEAPWMVSLRRDIPLSDGSWIRVSAMVHAYDMGGKPYIVPEDVTLAKRMIESIEPIKTNDCQSSSGEVKKLTP